MTDRRIDAFASQPQFLDHLAPIWQALPARHRGEFVVPGLSETARAAVRIHGIRTSSRRPDRTRPVLVASYIDERAVNPARVVLVEHGAGQHYGPWLSGDPGGRGRPRVVAYLAPNAITAERFGECYPHVRCEVVGCPKLDGLAYERGATVRTGDPVVAFTWHWDGAVVPEARSAWPHWRGAFAEYAGDLHRQHPKTRLLGHAHPRVAFHMRHWYEAMGVTWAGWLGDVLTMASVVVADNTSALYEAGALDVPSVVLDAPWYRRDVEHGLRFWEYADVGVRIGSGDTAELAEAIERALVDEPAQAARRREIAAAVYAYPGAATARAVDVLLDLLSQPLPEAPMAAGYHDPYRGTHAQRSQPAQPTEDGVRRQIVGWFAFHQLRPTQEMVRTWRGMTYDQLVLAREELDGLTDAEVAALREGSLVDVTASVADEPPPERASEIILWVAQRPDRARIALAHEQARPPQAQRPTVLDAIRAELLSAS